MEKRHLSFFPRFSRNRLDVLAHHGNHQVEQTHGFDESETQNGVCEELTTQGRVAGNTQEESSEDETDTDTGTTETNGGRTHTDVLGDGDHSLGDLRGVLAARLVVGEDLTSVGLEESGRLLTLHGLEGLRTEGSASVGEGTLGNSSTHGRASSDPGGGGHGRSQARGEDAGGGHCDVLVGFWGRRGVEDRK